MDQTKAAGERPIWVWFLLLLYLKSTFVLFNLYEWHLSLVPWSFLTLVPLLLILSLSFLLKDKYHFLYLLIVSSLISTLFMADLIYTRGFDHQVSIYIILATGMARDLGGSIISLIHPADFLLLADLPFLVYGYVRKYRGSRSARKTGRAVIIALLSAVTMVSYAWSLNETGQLGNYQKYPLLMSPLGNHFYDVGRFVYEETYQGTAADVQRIDAWHARNQPYMGPAEGYAAMAGIFQGKNLIAIQVESLENILIGLDYENQAVTPNLNRLLANSLYFSHVVEQVRAGNSSDAELLFNTSMYPVANGSAFLRFGDNAWNSLPKILKTAGYTSIAVHGDDKAYWNRDVTFASMGFERYVDESQFDPALLPEVPKIGMGIIDESLFDQSVREIEQLPEPYYAFLITITSHMPFAMPPEYQKLDLTDDVTHDYLQSIHYADAAFGEFYRELEAKGILEEAVLVIYGDHEGIHKYYPTDLSDNGKLIPFIIHAPGLEPLVLDNPGGQVDLMPTLLFLMGIAEDTYASTVMGRNLLGAFSGSPILPTGETAGSADDVPHLKEALPISDLAIRVDYLKLREMK